MSYINKPKFHHPRLPTNELGLTRRDYEGTLTTLCGGCGHDSISAAIIQAAADMSLEPHRVAKVSGIGCSSKIPSYFLSKSHGFNSVHGRMPSVATGANLANKELYYIGISGDGDSASIGLGQFCHIVRRRINMLYMVANNGTYGLTKGQDSATADLGSINKSGSENQFQGIDLVSMALELGASFVARSFSGDKEQLVPLIKTALSHSGFAFIDVISPCVTFNNNKGSTKSYDFVRAHNAATSDLDYVPLEKEITASYAEGSEKVINFRLVKIVTGDALACLGGQSPLDVLQQQVDAGFASDHSPSPPTQTDFLLLRESTPSEPLQRIRDGAFGGPNWPARRHFLALAASVSALAAADSNGTS